jgi:hypothetical protein
MKISVDGKDLFELTETQKKVIMNDIHEDIFDEDMKRRLQWVLTHKYERCLERLKNEWMPILKENMQSIPTNDEALAEIIFEQKDYKSRKDRENKI